MHSTVMKSAFRVQNHIIHRHSAVVVVLLVLLRPFACTHCATMPSYYDINTILSEEDLVPCTNLFDFSHLAHLDPDLLDSDKHYLPEGSQVKLPLWAMEKWAMLGFVRMSLPRHYNRKSRERLDADPSEADLRKRNERYFESGRMIVGLVERCSSVVAAAIAATPGRRNTRRNAHTAAMARVNQEAMELRRTLLVTFTGERLRKTLDWSMSSVGDDVTAYTKRLTEEELLLFQKGAQAAAAHAQWKTFGTRRMSISASALRTASLRTVTPVGEERPAKRTKTGNS